MSIFLALPLARVDPVSLGFFVPLIAFIFAFGIIFTSIYFKYQRRRMWHETARIALEKGQPLPPEFGNEEPRVECPPQGADIRRGLILVAVGVGLYLGLPAIGAPLIGAYVVGLIGVALLLSGILALVLRNKTENPPERSPLTKP